MGYCLLKIKINNSIKFKFKIKIFTNKIGINIKKINKWINNSKWFIFVKIILLFKEKQ